MPSRKVAWYPGACCHVTARGNHRNDIFRDEEDFQYYLILIKEASEYFKFDGYKIVCYCLMDNHVHILIKTKESPPGKFIGRINGMYAKYFNNKYNYIGHLFQDRYHPEFIESDFHMLDVSRYIHLNPVKANMVKYPQEYQWSSYNMYIGIKEEHLIYSEEILGYFNKNNRRELYKEFVESTIQISETLS